MKSIRNSLSGRILRQVAELRRLEDALRDCLPAECCEHCRVARIEQDTLHLVADSPAWRARLQFYSTRIIRHFNCLGNFSVKRVQIRVTRVTPPAADLAGRAAPRPVPRTTARAFGLLADDTDDPVLRDALKRLAGRGPERGSGPG